MVELEREDIHAALLLSWLKYTPVTQEDVEKMKNIDVLVSNSKRKKLARIKNSENQETPDAQLSKKVKNSSSGLVNLSRFSSGSAGKTLDILEKSKRKLVRIKNSENQETPDAQLSKKVKNSSSGLMGFSRSSSGSAGKNSELAGISERKLVRINKTENQETPDTQLSKKGRNSPSGLMNLSRNSSDIVEKNVRNSSSGLSETVEKSKGKLVRIKKTEIQETPEVELPKKVRNSTSGLGNSSQIVKRVRVSPSKLFESLPRFPPIECLRTIIGQCSTPFMKNLTKSDVDEHQGRLLLNNEDVRKNLLPLLNEECEDLANGIKVKTFDPMGNYYNMRFKTWGNYKSYVLLGSWRQFIQEHKLKENDCVTIWMFRHNENGELCFALTWGKDDDDEEARVVGMDPEAFRSER